VDIETEVVCIPHPETEVVDPEIVCFTLPVNRELMPVCDTMEVMPSTDGDWYMDLLHRERGTGIHYECHQQSKQKNEGSQCTPKIRDWSA